MHGHMYGDLSNLVLHAAQEAGREYGGELTVDDVMEQIARMPKNNIASMADPSGYGNRPEAVKIYREYFVESAKGLEYETVVDIMHDLVELGELTDGYEDFFYLPAAR